MFTDEFTDQILPICPTAVCSISVFVERVPYDGVGEHLLGLAAAEGVEGAAAAAGDGEADDGVGGEDAAEGGEQQVAQGQEHVALEPDPSVSVPAAAPAALLVPRGRTPEDLVRAQHVARLHCCCSARHSRSLLLLLLLVSYGGQRREQEYSYTTAAALANKSSGLDYSYTAEN